MFLTGKTTLLRHVLETSEEKIACIVNDVASINIDAKLVRNDRNRARGEQVNTVADLADTIELQNGCACECSWLHESRRTVADLLMQSLQHAQVALWMMSSLSHLRRSWHWGTREESPTQGATCLNKCITALTSR
jgi:hypothetical protein